MQVVSYIAKPKRPKWRFELDKMKINQSTQISIAHYNCVKSVISQRFHARTSKAFTTAKEPGGFFRVWRVS
jgi:hypothetical protein